MHVRLVSYAFIVDGFYSGLLGQGAFGRVIQVMRDSDGGQKQFFALKLVEYLTELNPRI
ncbi:MAG: hypothetical protein ACK55I_20100 [bacterium]